MSSPNEPDRPPDREAPVTGPGSGDAPPWQRGPRPDGGPPAAAAPAVPARPVSPPGPDPYADKRVSRYVTGIAAPDLTALDPRPQPGRTDTRPQRVETAPAPAYPSELPDLSASPRPAPPPRQPDFPPGLRGQAARILVGNRPRGPVRASMQIRRIDPWSALRVSLLLSVALFFVWMIAVAVLYLVLGVMGVWSKLNSNVGDLLTGTGGGGELVSAGSVFGGALLIGLVNIVLLTAMATVGAYIYNLSTDIVGGVEVTLADLD